MNRLFLKDWGLGLSDEDFAQALAAAGIHTTHPLAWARETRPSHSQVSVRFAWSLTPQDVSALPSARTLVEQWKSLVLYHRQISLVVRNRLAVRFWDRWELARTLGRVPEVSGLTLEGGNQWPQATAWRLPIFIGTMADDGCAQWLLDRESSAPPNWPFRYVITSRQHDRHQVLIFSKPLRQAVAELQTSAVRPKCCVAIVNGLDNETVQVAWPMIQDLCARLSASGIMLLPVEQDAVTLAHGVHRLAFELTHDLPIDVATQKAFGHDAVLIGNVSLLKTARISQQVRALKIRLQQMPRSRSILLSERSVGQLTRAKLPQLNISKAIDLRGSLVRALPGPVMGEAMAGAAPDFEFVGESHEASALTELAEAVRNASAQAVVEAPVARFVQQQSFVRQTPAAPFTQVFDAYVVAESVLLKIRIGHRADPKWQSSKVEFPFHELPPNESTYRLSVMFHEPHQLDQPLLADLELPRTGSSSEAEFSFTPKAPGPFEGRISVLHRGRVLQTALLRTWVVKERGANRPQYSIELADEVLVRHDWTSLDQRRRFDLALLCNHDDAATPRVTGVADRRAWATDLSGIDSVVSKINTLLSQVANNTMDYSDGLDKGENPRLLLQLAAAGRALRKRLVVDQLAPTATGGLDLGPSGVTHIQIVATRIDAVVPIEFIYDYEAATASDASVCPDHRQALESGACRPDCPGKKHPSQHVCPMGFWGVRMVIERHLFDAKKVGLADHALELLSESTSARSRLEIRCGALVGYSDRVTDASVDPLLNTLKAGVHEGVYPVKSWDEWANAVAAHSPQLLIAFPHNDQSGFSPTLELGGEAMATEDMRVFKEATTGASEDVKWHVRPPLGAAPLVLLLGCDTAGTAESFGSHVSAFRQAGAAIVVSTIATVFGEHAVSVGTSIAAEMLKRTTEAADPNGQGVNRFGEILRAAKRQALLDSLPMALCVVAFGDADWRL